MRTHIEMDDSLVARIDAVAGPKGRSQFVRDAVRAALEEHERVERLRAAKGSIADVGHDWDDDPAAWVRDQRREDGRRAG
jgi:metal-responsive CopG/Arc/MetJ family transcriptional regulator